MLAIVNYVFGEHEGSVIVNCKEKDSNKVICDRARAELLSKKFPFHLGYDEKWDVKEKIEVQ